jgi:hypothetical protein
MNVDDAVSICIYFGLLCNGTSNLAAAWKDLERNKEYALQWIAENTDKTRVFNLLIQMEEN